MTGLLIFIVSACVSLAGSLQLGAVNSAVIQTALEGRRNAGYLTALGGSIPEFIYCAIVCWFQAALSDSGSPWVGWYVVGAAVFMLIGAAMFVRGVGSDIQLKTKSRFMLPPFALGLVLGMGNPQLLPFWWFVMVQMHLYFTFDTLGHKLAFAAGAFGGAFLVLALLNYWADRYRASILKRVSMPWIHKIIGALLILLGLIQLFQLV